MRLTEEEHCQLDALLAPYLADASVQQMDGYVQHGCVSTLDHCRNVAAVSFWLNRRLHVRADEADLAAAALLHDYYLYDWHGAGWRHSYRHAGQASRNAVDHFGVNGQVQAAIASHMWPISPLRPPASRVGVLVCVADKISALAETLFCRKEGRPVCS